AKSAPLNVASADVTAHCASSPLVEQRRVRSTRRTRRRSGGGQWIGREDRDLVEFVLRAERRPGGRGQAFQHAFGGFSRLRALPAAARAGENVQLLGAEIHA